MRIYFFALAFYASTRICRRIYACTCPTSMILHFPNQPRFAHSSKQTTETTRRIRYAAIRNDTARHDLPSNPPRLYTPHPALFYIIRTKTPPSLDNFFFNPSFSRRPTATLSLSLS
ncbi:hypothetical protein J3F84DRAFT_385771 [Trichoderma pleuroticola]